MEDISGPLKDSDVLVGGVFSYFAPIVAHRYRIPYVAALISPLCLFSAYDPPVYPSLLSMEKLRGFIPPLMNKLLYKAVSKIISIKPVFDLQKKYGMEGRCGSFLEGSHSSSLNLCLWSEIFAPLQKDRPRGAQSTGFIFYPDEGEELPQDLEDFCRGPGPVVVFTLGSIVSENPEFFLDIFFSVAQKINAKVVVTIGKASRERYGHYRSSRCYITEQVSYMALFPKANLIVHQGGVGTTARCLRAGLASNYSSPLFGSV